MKKFIAILAILAFLPMTVWAGPKVSRNGGGQHLDAELTAIAGLTSAANAIPYFTGSGTAGTITSSANIVSWLASADYATARTNLGLAIGTNVQAYNADLATLAAGGSANCLWGEKSDSSGIECKSTINVQIDDSAAQFYNATNTTRKIKADASGITADSKTYTIKPIADVDVTFSPGKTYTDGKWCTYATATGFTCNEDAPAGSGDVTGVGDCTGGACLDGSSDGGTTISLYDGDSNKATIDAPDISGDITITLPGVTGTLATLGANTFTAKQTFDATTGIQVGATGVLITSDDDGAITFLGASGGYDEDLTINLDDTENTAVVSSSTGVTKVDFSALNLVTTGAIHGAIEVISDDTSLDASQCYGSFNDTNGAETITLPTAVVGMNLCIYSNDATVKTIDPYSSEVIELNGTALTGGYAIKSPGAAGNFICLICRSTGVWTTLGQSGVWVTNGS